MNTQLIERAGPWAAVGAGVAAIAAAPVAMLYRESTSWEASLGPWMLWLLVLMTLLGTVAAAALHLRQGRRAGPLGLLGTLGAVGGGILGCIAFLVVTVWDQGPFWTLFLLMLLVFLVGHLLLAPATWQAGVLPRPAAIAPLLVGGGLLAFGILASASSNTYYPFPSHLLSWGLPALLVIAGVGWLILGTALRGAPRPRPIVVPA